MPTTNPIDDFFISSNDWTLTRRCQGVTMTPASPTWMHNWYICKVKPPPAHAALQGVQSIFHLNIAGQIMVCGGNIDNDKCIGLTDKSKNIPRLSGNPIVWEVASSLVLPNGNFLLMGSAEVDGDWRDNYTEIVKPGFGSTTGPEIPSELEYEDLPLCGTVINDTTALVIARRETFFYSIPENAWSKGCILYHVIFKRLQYKRIYFVSGPELAKPMNFDTRMVCSIIEGNVLNERLLIVAHLSKLKVNAQILNLSKPINSESTWRTISDNRTMESLNGNDSITKEDNLQLSTVLGREGELYNLTCKSLDCFWYRLPWNWTTSSSLASTLSEHFPWIIKLPEMPRHWSIKLWDFDEGQAYHTHYHNGNLDQNQSNNYKIPKRSSYFRQNSGGWRELVLS